jgi:hypothetical protein
MSGKRGKLDPEQRTFLRRAASVIGSSRHHHESSDEVVRSTRSTFAIEADAHPFDGAGGSRDEVPDMDDGDLGSVRIERVSTRQDGLDRGSPRPREDLGHGRPPSVAG